MPGPLAGIRVLDLTTVLLGPYCTQILAEYGAEVLKLEAPEGDVVRQIGPERTAGMGGMFLTLNRGKRGACLDLKRPEHAARARDLVARADVLVTNIRPAAMARLGLDAASLRAADPRLIHAAIVGFGQAGPYGPLPAYDDLIQGLAALPHLTQRQGSETPRYTPLALADRVTGLHTLAAVLAALVERGRTGQGQEVEVPMFEVMTSLVLGDHLTGLTYDPPEDGGGYARLLSRDRRPYATKDGHICAVIYNDAQWRRFFTAIGQPGRLDNDPRMANHTTRSQHIDAIYAELGEILATRTTAEWLQVLGRADVPCAPAHTLDSLRADPHLNAVGFFQEEDHPTEGKLVRMAAPVRFSAHGEMRPAPTRRLGEDGPAILREAGLEPSRIAALLESGAMVVPAGVGPPVPETPKA